MKIKEILDKGRKRFSEAEDLLSVEVLLLHAIKKQKEFLITDADYELSPEEFGLFESYLNRYLNGEPVAYITNLKEFYGLDFFVDNRVLIPRPETEMLVDEVLKFLKERAGMFSVIDVGTGSGAIAVSIAKNTANAKVTAVDLSAEAVDVAKINAKKNGVNVEFSVSDLLASVSDKDFDVIVANLPYIGTERFNFVSEEAKKFEPHLALFGGNNGLVLYEKLFQQILEIKNKPKLLLGEFGFLQSEEMLNLLNKYFVQEQVELVKDLASIERMFVVRFHA